MSHALRLKLLSCCLSSCFFFNSTTWSRILSQYTQKEAWHGKRRATDIMMLSATAEVIGRTKKANSPGKARKWYQIVDCSGWDCGKRWESKERYGDPCFVHVALRCVRITVQTSMLCMNMACASTVPKNRAQKVPSNKKMRDPEYE